MNIESIKKAKEGDKEEIGKIILENMQALYRVAFSILKTESEIEDAVSNTVVIIFEKIHSLKNEEYFKTWMTRILINECYKIYNQNKKFLHLDNYNKEDTYDINENDLNIKDLIRKLDKDLKTIVILYYFEEFSIKEISEILKIPTGTVKSRLARARAKLQKNLIENEEGGH
jgi:RNA polymerase sigma-70 factor (ECF subfamily)